MGCFGFNISINGMNLGASSELLFRSKLRGIKPK